MRHRYNIDMNDPCSIKERLRAVGFEVEPVIIDGTKVGVMITKNGVRVHRTPRACVDTALEILEENE